MRPTTSAGRFASNRSRPAGLTSRSAPSPATTSRASVSVSKRAFQRVSLMRSAMVQGLGGGGQADLHTFDGLLHAPKLQKPGGRARYPARGNPGEVPFLHEDRPRGREAAPPPRQMAPP